MSTDTALTLSQLLVELREVSATRAALENRQTELVVMARALGVSWEKVGETIGISKQAAWERFAREAA